MKASDKVAGMIPAGIQEVTFFWTALGVHSLHYVEFQFCFSNDGKRLNCLKEFIYYKNSLRDPLCLLQSFLIFLLQALIELWNSKVGEPLTTGSQPVILSHSRCIDKFIRSRSKTNKRTENIQWYTKREPSCNSARWRVSDTIRNTLESNLYTKAGITIFIIPR